MRVTNNVSSHQRRKKLLKSAKGFSRSRRKLVRQAKGAVDRANKMAYSGRKQKKRQYRRLWTVRINAACRSMGTNYSWFINGLKKAEIDINRKMLAELAVNDTVAFAELVKKANAATAK